MKRNTLNFWIDLLTFLIMWMLTVTGLLIHYVLPDGQGRGRSWFLWGWNRHDYGDLHFYLALSLIVLCVIHVWLHWGWVCHTACCVFTGQTGIVRRNHMYGAIVLAGLIVITIGALYVAKINVKTIGRMDPPGLTVHSLNDSLPMITGQTTLTQTAQIANVPVDDLIQHLNLPKDVDRNEQLGRLKYNYGIDLNQLRQWVYDKRDFEQ